MGAARRTQRAQEHAQRRIARSEPEKPFRIYPANDIGSLMKERDDAIDECDRLRAALDEIKNWSLMGSKYVNARALIMDILDRHGIGGDQ